jgi:hypothetical protein
VETAPRSHELVRVETHKIAEAEMPEAPGEADPMNAKTLGLP